jgi:hypothetical protein
LVERYNKCVKEGLRKFVVAAGAKFAWTDFVGDIAAGLRMLPTRNGYSPFLLVFKQEPHWGAWGEHVGIGAPDVTEEGVDEALLAQQLHWWEAVLALVRRRLTARDQAMVQEYLRRTDLAQEDLRYHLEPGDAVWVKQRLPGKLQAKAEGPYTFLRYVGHNHLGGEVMD